MRARDLFAGGILSPLFSKAKSRSFRNDYDGGRSRRRLKGWNPTANTINTILTSRGDLLRARCRDAMRNNAHAISAAESFTSNLIGTGIKPSCLLTDQPELRKEVMQAWSDWCQECDADGLSDFYGMQTTAARSLFEAGELFIRFRSRRMTDGLTVPLQIQLLESEMCPYFWNQLAPNGNYIMNGIELDFRGRRVAYWMYEIHPGDALIEPGFTTQPIRVPASEILHIFRPLRPGQMRGVPIIAGALVRMFFLDQYDDAEMERKRIAAMFAGFISSPSPEDIIPIDGVDESAPEENVGLTGLEPGTLQALMPGEEITFSEPADVGGAYEMFQYRQQLALFAAVGVPYSLCTSDLRRANYSSMRGTMVEYRRRLGQLQANVIIFQMGRPIWKRWYDLAVMTGAISLSPTVYLAQQKYYQRARWIPEGYETADPLKDTQADKLAVDSGFKPRSDVVEARGYDPEENDERIAADKAREEKLDLVFPFATAAANQPLSPDQQDAADEAAQQAADEGASSEAA